jgi:hypothetical protein
MLIINRLFRSTAKFCICDRPVMHDLRSLDMRNFCLTCRTWNHRWRNFVYYIVIRAVQFCSQPNMCWQTYMQAAPRLPIFRRKMQPCDRQNYLHARIYKNGRVLVMLKSASAVKPGEGTLN